MVLDASLLSTQHYKVRIKGKVEQSRKGVAPSPKHWCSSYRKGSLRVTLDYGRQLYFTYSDPNNKRNKKIYFGSTQGYFKTRYYNHKTSFSHEKYKHSTTLSSDVWEFKDNKGIDPIMKWEVKRNAVNIGLGIELVSFAWKKN